MVVFEVTRDQFEAVLNDRPEIAGEISRLVARRQAATVGAANADEPADIEREERLLRQRILDNMAKVFSGLRGKAAQSQSAARA